MDYSVWAGRVEGAGDRLFDLPLGGETQGGGSRRRWRHRRGENRSTVVVHFPGAVSSAAWRTSSDVATRRFPEVASAAGVVRGDGVLAQAIKRWRDASIRRASANVVLGPSMREVVLGCGVEPQRIAVIPNWADGDKIAERGEAAQRLRQAWNLDSHFVVRLLRKPGSRSRV